MDILGSSIFDLKELSLLLKEGSAALFPTDTLPALAACPAYSKQLWEIKQRPTNKPLILMGSSPKQLFEFVLSSALEDAWLMASSYWPGALTMALPASGTFVEALNPGENTLGMRVPASSQARDLLELCGPLATTSANLSGFSPSLTAETAANCFPGVPLLGPVPWPSSSGLASTVILWERPGHWQVLRSGAVIIESLQSK